MPAPALTLDRPQRWDSAFDPEMADATVERLLTLAPFSKMNPENFPKRASLRDILKHDTRIKTFKRGEIIVREGDYGTSAFLVMSGNVRVVLGPDLPPSVLGRRVSKRKSLFRVIAQLWSNTKEPESISPAQLNQDSRVAARGAGDEVKIFLQDVPPYLERIPHGHARARRLLWRDRRAQSHAAHRLDFCGKRTGRTAGNPLAGLAGFDEIR
jgi:hypothetical protein